MRNDAGQYIPTAAETVAAAAADPNSEYSKLLALSSASSPQPVAETASDVVERLEGELRELDH